MISFMKKASKSLLLVPAVVFALAFSATPVSAVDCSDATAGGISAGAECAAPSDAAQNLFGEDSIFQIITNILLFLIGAVSVIMLIIGGIRYVTSNGDQAAVTGAKNTILYAIIGVVVAFLAFAAVRFVTDQLQKSTYEPTSSQHVALR
ncbi:MAG: pilin [Candidatus Woesebacteria bacterium]|jgi:hypothetical protein